MPETSIQQETQSTWAICRDPVLLTMVGGAIDTIGFIALFGFYCSCDGQLGIGRGCVGEGWCRFMD